MAMFREHNFSDFEDKLSAEYRTWEYLVQYRESDFNFVSRIMEQEGIVDRVRTELAPHFKARLAALGSSPVVGEVRNLGLFGAIELVADRETLEPIANGEVICERFRDLGFEEGIIARPIETTVLLAPPLVISLDQIDELFDGFERALTKFEPIARAAATAAA